LWQVSPRQVDVQWSPSSHNSWKMLSMISGGMKGIFAGSRGISGVFSGASAVATSAASVIARSSSRWTYLLIPIRRAREE